MERRGDSGLPASVETAWGLAAGHGRGRPPTLSLDRIVEAGVRLASAHGLGSVSMGRVAAELGSSTMALYRHVATKDELLALMVDAALGSPPPAATEGWRTGLAGWAWAQHERIRAHPWTVRVPISGPPITPNQVAWLEAALRLLAPTGLAEHEKASAVLLLSGYVRGEATLTADIEAHFASADPDRAMSAYADLLRRLLEPERFPALHALLAAGVFDHADDPDVEFAFGLERILDGIGALVAPRA
jgi:AcrR family transcriptional regulator